MVQQEMASPFRASQGENADTAINCDVTDTTKTETKSSSIRFQDDKLQSRTISVFQTLRRFFRRRIVLLALSLVLSIVIIALTIVGVLMSPNPEDADDGTKQMRGLQENRNETNTSLILPVTPNSGVNVLDKFQNTTLKDSLFSKAETDDDGSGHSSEESTTIETYNFHSLFGNRSNNIGVIESGLDSSGDTSEEDQWRWHGTKSSRAPFFIENNGNEIISNED